MIERYNLFEIENLRDRFVLPDGVPAGVKKSYNISPTQFAPVVLVRDGKRIIERKMWGFVPASAKDTRSVFRYKTTVAKSEGLFDKPTWRDVAHAQRCLVPANGYYEWRKTIDGKRPFYVQVADQPLLSLAGVYSTWTDVDGKEVGTFAIVTVGDNSHTGRSPVVIASNDEADWLNPAVNDASSVYGIIRPLSSDMLTGYEVTTDLKNSKLNSPSLLNPVK
ncbi:MAG: SOS response-associated peptidase [Candidatus Saccharimonas sp.]